MSKGPKKGDMHEQMIHNIDCMINHTLIYLDLPKSAPHDSLRGVNSHIPLGSIGTARLER